MSESELQTKIRNVVKKLVQSQIRKPAEGKYAAASDTLHSLIAASTNLKTIQHNWRCIVNEFHWSNLLKSNKMLRDDFGKYITQIGYLLGDEDVGSFLKYLEGVCMKSKREGERCFYLQIIADYIRVFHENSRTLLPEHVNMIMDMTKSYLDDNDSPQELIPLLDICLEISRIYPREFTPYFHDICDFVIGWYMDRNQPDFVEIKCHEMICAFKPFFQANIGEAIGFLMSLIDDLIFTVQELAKQKEQKDYYFVFSNIVSILVVFEDIWQISFTSESLSQADELTSKLFDNLEEVMAATEKCGGKLAGITILHFVNVLLCVAEVRASSDSNADLRAHVQRLLGKAYACPVTCERDIVSTIRISEKIMANNKYVDMEELLKLLIDFCVNRCANYMTARLSTDMSAVFAKALNVSDLSFMQSTYKYIADKLQSEFESLAQCLESDLSLDSARHREYIIIALLSSLDSLVVAKNSIIVLRGLNPSLFSLLFTILPLCEQWLAVYFPDVFFRLLSLAKKFAETHNQFVANSDLLTSESAKRSFFIESPASKNFEQIILALSTLHSCVGMVNEDSENAIIDWLDALAKSVSSSEMARSLERHESMLKLQRAMLNIFVEQQLAKNFNGYKVLLTAIHRFGAFSALSHADFSKIFCQKLFVRADSFGREQFFKLISHLPANFLLSENFAKCINDRYFREQDMLGRPAMGSFYFQILSNFLINGIVPFHKSKENVSLNTCINLLYASMTDTGNSHITTNGKLAVIAQHYALFCVENRLKTPIGKAVDTFTKFDGAINRLVSEVNFSAEHEPEPHSLHFPDSIKRITFALEMIDAFDKLMNFANHGSTLSIANISAGSRHFFHTNEASWQGWLSRISVPAMSLCFATGRFSQIVRIADNLFHEVEKRFIAAGNAVKIDPITLPAICWLVRAYVELSAPLAICGVKRWVQRIYKTDMEWINCAELLASYNYESALSGFSDILAKENSHNCVMDAIRAMCVKAAKSCRHAAFTKPFCDSIVPPVVSTNDNSSPQSEYLKLQLESAMSLSNWTEFESISTQPAVILDHALNLSELLDRAEMSLAKAFCRPAKVDSSLLAEEKLSSLSSLILTENRDDSALLNAKSTILRHVFAILKATDNRMHIMTSKNEIVSAHKSVSSEKLIANNYANMSGLWNAISDSANLEVGQMLCYWISSVYPGNKIMPHGVNGTNGYQNKAKYTNLRATLISAHAEMAHIASKTGNNYLSQFHLHKYSELLMNSGNSSDGFNQKFSELSFATSRSFSPRQDSLTFIYANGGTPLGGKPRTVSPIETNANLKTFMRTAKITWNMENQPNPPVRADCFRNMLNVVCSHARPDLLPDSTQIPRRTLLGKMCRCLGKWSQDLPNSLNVLYQMQNSSPHFVLQKVLQFCDQLESDCAGVNSSELLHGSFLLTASDTAALASADVHYSLLNWALDQLYYYANSTENSEQCWTGNEATKILRVSANDSALFRRMGINFNVDDAHIFLSLLGKCKTIESFKESVKENLDTNDSSVILGALTSSEFLQTWILIKARQFKLFEIAVNASLNYLNTVDNIDRQNEAKIIVTCLRIMDFLSSQPEWFKQIVESSWLAKIDVMIWKDVIPQLFAHLGHSDVFVRQTALQILTNVGELAPQTVCYTAVVNTSPKLLGSILRSKEVQLAEMAGKVSPDSAETMDVVEEKLIVANLSANRRGSFSQKKVRFQDNCGRLVESLRRHFPDLIADLVEFCGEMQKVNVLREERWLYALTRLDGALLKRVADAESEFLHQFSYDHLTEEQKADGIRRRHEAIAAPVYEKLKLLFESTCVKTAETENDVKFCEAFKIPLEQALENFHENRHNLHVAFDPLRNIMNTITARAMKRSALSLQISDISPYLANLCASNVPVPGQQFGSVKVDAKSIITIQKVHDDVIILPTKTRPKKLTFTGSDGKMHTFLFKAHEDLRLDERVMQLSRACNSLLRSKMNKFLPFQPASVVDEFLNSTYSVTPLGPESGLIEWVDGATPLFHLYRKWKIRDTEDQESRRQQLELKAKALPPDSPNILRKGKAGERGRKSPTGTDASKSRDSARPTEQFFAKLKAVFAEEGLSADLLKFRQRWPTSCLEKVFAALVKETPQDILAKELWMYSGNSSTWWQVTRRFTRSIAAASIVGWTVLGLGDRHLDNVLVDLRTGRVVHVDYNVSFEKGRLLRVPETVPFRLSGNIIRALGPTGTEGMFRESAIHVLTHLRANKELILSMLEQFDIGGVDSASSNEREARRSPVDEFFAVTSEAQNISSDSSNASTDLTRVIRLKLSGCERIEQISRDDVASILVDEGRTSAMSPDKQVDYLIEKATDPMNLALLYEGWTAWV